MSEWQPIDTAPNVSWGERIPALVYSKVFGVKSGTVGNLDGYIFASVPNYHGDAVADWHVTHWMPLPEPPTPGDPQ